MPLFARVRLLRAALAALVVGAAWVPAPVSVPTGTSATPALAAAAPVAAQPSLGRETAATHLGERGAASRPSSHPGQAVLVVAEVPPVRLYASPRDRAEASRTPTQVVLAPITPRAPPRAA